MARPRRSEAVGAKAPRLRVLVADDDDMFAGALLAFLERDERIELVGRARTGDEAAELADSLDAGLVLMDIQMPVLNGIEAAKQILARRPETHIFMLTGWDDQDYASDVLSAGVLTLIEKGKLLDELPAAIAKLYI